MILLTIGKIARDMRIVILPTLMRLTPFLASRFDPLNTIVRHHSLRAASCYRSRWPPQPPPKAWTCSLPLDYPD